METLPNYRSEVWERVSAGQFSQAYETVVNKSGKVYMRMSEKGKAMRKTHFNYELKDIKKGDWLSKKTKLEQCLDDIQNNQKVSLSNEEKKYWLDMEKSALRRIKYANGKINGDEIQEHPVLKVKEHERGCQKWIYGLVSVGVIASLAAGVFYNWVQARDGSKTINPNIPQSSLGVEDVRLVGEPIIRVIETQPTTEPTKIVLPTLTPTSVEPTPTPPPTPEVREVKQELKVGGINFWNRFKIKWSEKWDKLKHLGYFKPEWEMNPTVITDKTDLAQVYEGFSNVGENPNMAQIYALPDGGVVIYGHSGNMRVKDLSEDWKEKLGLNNLENQLKKLIDPRVVLPMEKLRMAYELNGEKGVKEEMARIFQESNYSGYEVIDVRVVKDGINKLTEEGVRFFVKDESDPLAYINLEALTGMDEDIAFSGKPKVVFMTCADFMGGKSNGDLLVVTTELRAGNNVEEKQTQAEIDALAIENLINQYSISYKPDNQIKLGEYIGDSVFGQGVKLRLNKDEYITWLEALRFADQMTYAYKDEVIQCMVAAQLMYGLGEGTPVGNPILGAAELLNEDSGFNKFNTIEGVKVGRNIVYPKLGQKMINGEVSGHVETIVGEIVMPSGKGYWVLRANYNEPAVRYLIYEDELMKLLSSGDAVVVSLGNG